MFTEQSHCAASRYEVIIGRHRRNSWYEGEAFAVKSEVPHPGYRSRNVDNDFKLVFLTRAAPVDVALVRLNRDAATPRSGDTVTAMGWGDTIASDSYSQLSDTLKEVDAEAVSNQECRRASGYVGGYYTSYGGSITANMLCAAGTDGDSCKGDSGGPLIMKESDGDQDVQVGVVSWGVGCADEIFPTVYARVSAAYGWIEGEVCAKSANPPASFGCNYETYTTCGTAARGQADYRGTISVTESGKTCQAWSSQAPHAHTRTPAAYPRGGLGDHNHCRNPDNDVRSWCYTSDPASRWEFCAVPECGPEDTPAVAVPAATATAATAVPAAGDDGETSATCGTAARRQADYRGTVAVTESGRTCQAWSSQTPHTHTRTEATYPRGGLGDHNHCRNPDNNERAWCYTADPASRWEFCAVPECGSGDVPAVAATVPATAATTAATAPAATDTGTVGDGPADPSDDEDDGGEASGSFASWACSNFNIFC